MTSGLHSIQSEIILMFQTAVYIIQGNNHSLLTQTGRDVYFCFSQTFFSI